MKYNLVAILVGVMLIPALTSASDEQHSWRGEIYRVSEEGSPILHGTQEAPLLTNLDAEKMIARKLRQPVVKAVITNDPNGDLPHHEKLALACEVYSDRLFSGASVENVVGGLTAELHGYKYSWYLQHMLDYCVDHSQ